MNLLSVRFVIGFVLCLVVIPFTMIVSIDDYNNQMRIYHIDRVAVEREIENTRVYFFLRPTVIQEPEVLGAFSQGITPNIGNKVKIQINEYPVFPSGHSVSRDNPLLNAFFSLDFATVIAITISLLALVFSYDSITRERENGTMKLILTGKISRPAFVMGKLMGLLLTLTPILIFCYLLAAVILLANPGVQLSGPDWTGIILLLLTSMIYMLVFILLGMFISAKTAHSSSSIIISPLCWITFLFLIPNLATYASASLSKLPLYENVQTAIANYHKEYEKNAQDKWKEYHRELGSFEYYWENMNHDNDNSQELSGGTWEMTQHTKKMVEWGMPERLSYSDKIWALQKDYLDKLYRQQNLRQTLAWLSPSELFIQASDILCRTDADSFLDHTAAVRDYRDQFFLYFKKINAFSSYQWFTPMPEEDFRTVQEYEEGNKTKIDRERFADLDISLMPRYEERKSDPLDTFRSALGRLAALLSIAIVLLGGTMIVFRKYDVR
ncbi:MAG: ABC transporter permease subunit [Rikenellaceae bacterium]|nr:ABC transporter permease subunit [Rikenellaceae bacterium]